MDGISGAVSALGRFFRGYSVSKTGRGSGLVDNSNLLILSKSLSAGAGGVAATAPTVPIISFCTANQRAAFKGRPSLSVFQFAKQTPCSELFFGVYQFALSQLTQKSLLFGFNEAAKEKISAYVSSPVAINLVSGAITGFAEGTVLSIFESNGVRRQLGVSATGSRFAQWANVYKRFLLRDVPSATAFFGVSSFIRCECKVDKPSFFQNLAIGWISASSAAFVSTPGDVLKVGCLLEPGTSITSDAVAVFSNRGLRGFYAGLLGRLVRVPIPLAVTYAVVGKLFPCLYFALSQIEKEFRF